MSVIGDETVDVSLTDQALNHRHVQDSVGMAFPASNRAHFLLVDAKKGRNLGNPLVEERPAVNEDDGAATSLSYAVSPENGLADARGSDAMDSAFAGASSADAGKDYPPTGTR
jgi:hypothetical protein